MSLRRWILQHLVSGGTVIRELDDAYDDDDNDSSFVWWESRRAGLKPAWPTNLQAPDAGSSSWCGGGIITDGENPQLNPLSLSDNLVSMLGVVVACILAAQLVRAHGRVVFFFT